VSAFIFRLGSVSEFLERYLGVETQNNNENFLNSLIWTFAPKHFHSEAKVVKIASSGNYYLQ